MYEAKIVLDSENIQTLDRLTTFEITYPRFVHSELMTHRLFSRNSASSRAIPIKKMIQRIIDDPVLPVWWGKNQAGMQANEELDIHGRAAAEGLWLESRDIAVKQAKRLIDVGVHKQIVNRLLEPWMWITVILTATEFENFFYLRSPQYPIGNRKINPDFPAQPEIQKIARMMQDLYVVNEPITIGRGDWHVPYITEEEQDLELTDKLQLSVARCARVSYLTHDGKRDLEADFKLHARLAESGHWSCFEHQARTMGFSGWSGNFTGWTQYRKSFVGEHHGLLTAWR